MRSSTKTLKLNLFRPRISPKLTRQKVAKFLIVPNSKLKSTKIITSAPFPVFLQSGLPCFIKNS